MDAEADLLVELFGRLRLLPKVTFLLVLILGAIGVTRILVSIFDAIYCFLLRPSKDLSKYGAWAVVTGATDGIGKAYAKQLAKKKINVVLVSRTEEKLQEVARELETKFGIETKIVVADFSKLGSELEEAYSKLQALASSLEVGVLINNAGVSYPYAKYFHEVDDELISNLINVNCLAVTRVTKIFLPAMARRKKGGAIVNIGSGAATVLPSDPLYAVYAGTKAFVDQFSRTLYVEYSGFGIGVQCQAPLYVATKLAKIRHASITCPSADVYARYGLAWIGFEPRCTPYWVHALMWKLISLVPEGMMDTIRLMQSVAIRKKGMAKDAKKKQEE